MKCIEFKIVEVNNGFCRIVYSCKNDENQKIFYCLQDEGDGFGGIKLYRCTGEFEPEYEVRSFKDGVKARFEKPKGSSDLEKNAIKWIEGEEK